MNDLILDKSCPSMIRSDVEVYQKDDVYLACTLNQADVVNNCNKFYVSQLLKRKDGFSYFLFSRSGRVGQEGTMSLDCYTDEAVAVTDYLSNFKDRTGFSWDERKTHPKIDGKYDYIEMKYEDISTSTEVPVKSETILDSQVEYLMGLIFDEDTFKAVATQYGLDLSRAPLGAISSGQIKKAYAVLAKISEELSGAQSVAVFQRLTSDFYTIIPTRLKIGSPPLIDSEAQLQNKLELLKILDDTEIFSRLSRFQSGNINLADKYLTLGAHIEPVTDTNVVSMLTNYMTNTSSSAHGRRLKIHGIYSVEREEERSRFKKWENFYNRQLLWHGSGVSNYVGILSSGLRINPGNVIRSGSMFGNGIYFANCSSKSANYMKTSDIGIMLLCEVALGSCYEQHNANYITQLPTGYHSCHGVGIWTPTVSEQKVLNDGVIVPLGKLTTRSNQGGALTYDEFIVYDQSQVRIRYLFIVNVNG